MATQKRVKRPPVGGLVVILFLGGAMSVPFLAEGGCMPTTPSTTSEPMELRGHWLGMGLSSVTAASAAGVAVAPTGKGVVVVELDQSGAGQAAQAGMQMGDVIVRVDGSTVDDLAGLYSLTTRLDVGRPMQIDVLRQGQPLTITLLGRPMAPQATPPAVAGAQMAQQFTCPNDGMTWSHSQVAPHFQCPNCGGPLVK